MLAVWRSDGRLGSQSPPGGANATVSARDPGPGVGGACPRVVTHVGEARGELCPNGDGAFEIFATTAPLLLLFPSAV